MKIKKLINSKNVIVFGGAGFLGSHISDYLTDAGYKVTIFDKNKSKFIKKNQTVVIGDITNFYEVQKAIKNQKYVPNGMYIRYKCTAVIKLFIDGNNLKYNL